MPSRTCDRCGFENDAGAARCGACGNVLAAEAPAPTLSFTPGEATPATPPPPPASMPPASPGPTAPPAPVTPPTPPVLGVPAEAPAPSTEPIAGPPPALDRWPRVRGVLLGIEVLAAIGFAVLAFFDGRYGFLWAAVAFGLVPLGFAAVAAVRGVGRPVGIAVAVILVVVLAGSAFAVLTNCENRLKPGGDLSGCDLTGLALAGADLTGANFAETKLGGADLSGAKLERARFSDADLSGANLSRATLGGADLTGADLTGAELGRANLRDANLTRADLREAKLVGTVLAGVNFTGADLRGHDFSGAAFGGLILSGANLSGVPLTDAFLADARLDGANLSGADLESVLAENVDLSGADLGEANLRQATLFQADLSEASLRNANLHDAQLAGADLTGADLEGANLERVNLVGADGLDDATLAEALGVDESSLGPVTTEKRIALEAASDIRAALGPACRGRGVGAAASYGGRGPHPLVLANGRGGEADIQLPTDVSWEPAAARFGQLVACLDEEQEITVEVCQYVIASGAPGRPTRRVRFTRHVRVVEARTGKVVLSQTFEGGLPDQCPFTKTTSSTTGEDRLEGSRIGFGVLRPRLAELVR